MSKNSNYSYGRSDTHTRPRRSLYKNPDKAKICGVCAGLSEYFDFESWIVRLIAVSFFLFSGGTAVVAYFVACFIMEPKPGSVSNRGCFGNDKSRERPKDSEKRKYRPSVKEVWKKGSAPAEMLSQIESSFENIEQKLQKMESYVTSKKYQLDKEFEQIS
jgi:phage shock protein C